MSRRASSAIQHRVRALRDCLARLLAAASLLVAGQPAQALNFNLSYRPSTLFAPEGFRPAVEAALVELERSFTDPITVNLELGWGELSGIPLSASVLGQGQINWFLTDYDSVVAALQADASTDADAAVLQQLNGALAKRFRQSSFWVTFAEGKAIGLPSPVDADAFDGMVSFNSTFSWNFDPTSRGAQGSYDFIGVVQHEVSQVLGRAVAGALCDGCAGPLDFVRGTATPGKPAPVLIGTTAIATFNDGLVNTDLADFDGSTADAFNAVTEIGRQNPLTPQGKTLLDVLGYDPVPVPEPSTLTLVALGLGCMLARSVGSRNVPTRTTAGSRSAGIIERAADKAI